MKKKCKKNLAQNFKPSEMFVMHATAEIMEQLLKRLDLPDEKQVFDTTVAWLQHDWENRKQFAPPLFHKLRLGAVPVGHLSMTIFKSPNLYAIPECKQMIDNVMRLTDAAKPGDPPLHTVDYNLFATRTTVNGIIYIDRPARFYGPRFHKWTTLKTFPYLPEKDAKDTDDTCFNAKGNLYVSRGVKSYPRDLKCPQFLRLDVLNNKWLTLAPMNHRRENPTIVSMGDKIYAIGGGINTTFPEVYSIRENVWRNISAAWSMQHFTLGPTSGVAHRGNVLVYAARKGDENVVDHALYCYIADGDQSRIGDWYVLMNENHPVSDFTGLVTNEGKCYRVTGGNCKCKEDGCQWHQVCVHELLASFNTRTATVGVEQDQTVIPVAYRKKAFRINRDVYVIFCGRFYKVDRVKGCARSSQRVLLGKWDNLCLLNADLNNVKPYLTMLSFDKAKWL
ncbi:kelch-like protein 14 [Amphiura filiformis]|uniref:kelch-like protein 14 n=1 Tax=Amphiura filiformis TaxID=82378 RepID=UPI003B20C713